MFLARHASHSLLGPNSPLALAMPVLRWLTLVALATACAAANQAAPASVTRAAPAKRPAWRAPIGPYRGAQRQAAGLARPADVQRGLVEQVRECWWQAAARAAPLTPMPPSLPPVAPRCRHLRPLPRSAQSGGATPRWTTLGGARPATQRSVSGSTCATARGPARPARPSFSTWATRPTSPCT